MENRFALIENGYVVQIIVLDGKSSHGGGGGPKIETGWSFKYGRFYPPTA